MNKTILVKYDSATKAPIIENDGRYFDTERLYGIDISKWVYPFHENGVKWYGLYEELKAYYLHHTFSIIFDGDTSDYEILKNAIKEHPVDVKEKLSKVVILYDENQLSTKITINGKIFDTQRIEKRSIDEWVKPFAFKAASWKGIFGEIEEYIGNDLYSISFVGKQEDMRILIENAPENISIFYKPKTTSRIKTTPTLSELSNQKPHEETSTIGKNNTPYYDQKNTKINPGVFLNQVREEYIQMQNRDSGLLLFGKIAILTEIICCILFTIYLSRFLMIICAIPALIFCIIAFSKGYKKLASFLIVICVVLAIVSWVIITIRWNRILDETIGEYEGLGDEFFENQEKVGDIFEGFNNAMGS